MWVLILVPVAAGGYLLLRYLKGAKRQDFSLPPSNVPLPAVKATSPSIFPIKNGSPKNDLVVQLQGLLGVTADGLFGPKTQAALVLKTGKTSISSQAEFDDVIAKLSAAAKATTAATRAEQLINDWKKSTSLQLMAVTDTLATQVTEDAYGALTATGKVIELRGNLKLNRQDYVPLSATKNGFLKFKITQGGFAGLYKVESSKITVA